MALGAPATEAGRIEAIESLNGRLFIEQSGAAWVFRLEVETNVSAA